MGSSASAPGATRRDLHRIILVRKLSYEDLGRRWRVSPSCVSQRLTGDPPMSTDQLEIALEALGLDPVEFALGVKERFHPELELDDLMAPARRCVGDFRRRLLNKPAKGEYSPIELSESARGLETLRFRDARAAYRQAREILRCGDLAPDVAAEAWGVLGVIERHRGRAEITAFCLTQALRAGASPTHQARTLQRIAMMLFFNAGRPDQALKAIFRARQIYRLAEDWSGVGKTYVDEGVIQGMAGDHRAARRAHRRALNYLGEADSENRLCAFQGIAVASVFLGEVTEAFHFLDRAAAVLGDDEGSLYLLSILWWLRGEISLLVGEYAQAAGHLVAVWDAYIDLDIGTLEVTLISLRIAKAYWLQGNWAGFQQILEDLVSRENEVRRSNPLVASVLNELLRAKAEGAVTEELLEDAYLKMREGIQNVPPLLPSTLPS